MNFDTFIIIQQQLQEKKPMHNFIHLLHDPTSEGQSNKDIQKLCGQMMNNFLELEKMEKEAESEEEKKYLTTYLKILEQITTEVLAAKLKYRTLNRQALTAQRLHHLNTQIDSYRSYQKEADKELKSIGQQIKKYQKNNTVTEFQNECLRKAIERKKVKLEESKSFYLTCSQHLNRKREHSSELSRIVNQKTEDQKGTRGHSASSYGRRIKTAKVVANQVIQQLEGICEPKRNDLRNRMYWTKKHKQPFCQELKE